MRLVEPPGSAQAARRPETVRPIGGVPAVASRTSLPFDTSRAVMRRPAWKTTQRPLAPRSASREPAWTATSRRSFPVFASKTESRAPPLDSGQGDDGRAAERHILRFSDRAETREQLAG
jgi:hypothetical protein